MVLRLGTVDEELNNGNMLFGVMKANMLCLGQMGGYTAGERLANHSVIPMLTQLSNMVVVIL